MPSPEEIIAPRRDEPLVDEGGHASFAHQGFFEELSRLFAVLRNRLEATGVESGLANANAIEALNAISRELDNISLSALDRPCPDQQEVYSNMGLRDHSLAPPNVPFVEDATLADLAPPTVQPRLEILGDVDFDGLADDDSAFFNSSTGKWRNRTPSEARGDLGLSTSTPVSGTFLSGDATPKTVTVSNGIVTSIV